MSISVGDKLGPYEIVDRIGAGGMGEVFRARDSRLGRDVAIKTSAQRFNERFEREARAIAALNHPNICHVYDVGENYLVMELIEGESPQGPLPLETVVNYARQIADALDAAHEKGIIHRDLKPGNIKITPDGTVKVLDFGLAKVTADSAASSESSPTITMGATEAGMILGTAAYMSPEQARGKAVDKRTDIWAFGVVLYELLTGKRPFGGETLTDTFVSVVKEDPDWDQIPTQLRGLVRRCLEKDPKRRLRDIGDVAALLDAQPAGPAALPASPALPVVVKQDSLRSRFVAAFAILVTFALIALAIVHFRAAAPGDAVRFRIPLPENINFTSIGAFAVSPDGRKLAFLASGADGVSRVWVRNLGSLEPQPLPGAETGGNSVPVFWSPDSRNLVFQADGRLKKIDTSGGPAQTLCDAASEVDGVSWNRDGVIIFSMGGHVRRVSAAGGIATDLSAVDPARGETAHLWPTFLPDGQHFLYARRSSKAENTGFYVGSLDASPGAQDTKRLMAVDFQPAYAPPAGSGAGQILFLRDGTLFAQPFDAGKRELSGEPVPIAEQVGNLGQLGYFSASGNGVLVYRTGGAEGINSQLTWFNRKGEVTGMPGEAARYTALKLSPDGKKAAAVRADVVNTNADIWVVDLSSGAGTRFTFDPAVDDTPVWSPDGSQIAWLSNRGGYTGIYRKASNGAGTDELLSKVNVRSITDWSRDGRFIIYQSTEPQTKSDIWALPVGKDAKGTGKAFPVIQTPASELGGYLSPDGRWLAYLSDESGHQELYVQPFNSSSGPGAAQVSGKWMVSRGSQGMARWRADGKELLYVGADGAVMSVDVTSNPVFQASAPKLIFPLPLVFFSRSAFPGARADVTRDLQQFLLTMPAKQTMRQELSVILNWQSALKH